MHSGSDHITGRKLFHSSHYLDCYFQLFGKLLDPKEASLLEDTWKTFRAKMPICYLVRQLDSRDHMRKTTVILNQSESHEELLAATGVAQ